MRVVSLVPSWTETLLACGVNVVGRTRFCLHPSPKVASIPRVGGTKDWQWERILSLKPDLLVLDREENPRFMGEQTEVPFVATHITRVEDVPRDLRELGRVTGNVPLGELAARWDQVLLRPRLPAWSLDRELPGLLQWGLKPERQPEQVAYVIWKDPWMAVSRDTFIGSVLERVGFAGQLADFPMRYPTIDLERLDRTRTLLLFSSEPYPFLKRSAELSSLGFAHAFVDGECFSWFGLRSLEFISAVTN